LGVKRRGKTGLGITRRGRENKFKLAPNVNPLSEKL
jgi:hypothetical protein